MSSQISKREMFSKAALTVGTGAGALALLTAGAAADTPFTSFGFPITGGTVNRTTPDRFSDIINVKEFGAVGNGQVDDRSAIQAAFNAAFGPWNAPHGNANKHRNRPVFFPGGNYRVTGPLYLIGVQGGHIFGNGIESTTISFENPGTGNLVIPSGTGSEVTPAFMMNGCAYLTFENMTIGSNSSVGTAGIYYYSNGLYFASACVFRNLVITNFYNGILAGYGGSGGNCDNCRLENVAFINCPLAGLRLFHANALNWGVYGGGGAGCGTASTGPLGNLGGLYSCVSGGLSPICNPSMSGNEWDIMIGSSSPMTIIGGSSESNRFLGAAGTGVHVSGVAWRPTDSNGCTFIDAHASGLVKVDSCLINPGNNTGPFTIISLLNTGRAIVDMMNMGPGGVQGIFTGIAGSRLYLRGNSFYPGSSPLNGFTGTVAQNI